VCEFVYCAVITDRYPQGLPWSAPRDALGVFATWMPTEPAPDGFASLALDRARSQHDHVALCKNGGVPRLTLGSSLGAVGIYEDYVFLDSLGRVLVAFLRFIDSPWRPSNSAQQPKDRAITQPRDPATPRAARGSA
jgi:hypothetical protein